MKKFIMYIILVCFTPYAFADGQSGHHHDTDSHDRSDDMHHHDHADDHGVNPVGHPADAKEATKTIMVSLVDAMRIEFDQELDLQANEIVRFVVTNEGQIPHEFSIGTEEEQDSHRQMMREMPHMQHEDGNTITVQPGETKELTWQFTAYPKVVFACNIPGHFEAGMHHSTSVKLADTAPKATEALDL